jgi:hypothetical protein
MATGKKAGVQFPTEEGVFFYAEFLKGRGHCMGE